MTKFVAVIAVVLFVNSSNPAHSRPAGCPHAWCGCWLAMQYGFSGAKARALWLARNWAAMFPRTALAPGAVAVFARGRGGHVGKVVDVAPGKILLQSGNDGRAVRTRWRSTRGLIAAVSPHGSYASAAPARSMRVSRRTAKQVVRHPKTAPTIQYAHAAS